MKKNSLYPFYSGLGVILSLLLINPVYADYTDEFWATGVAIDKKNMPLKLNNNVTATDASYNPQLKQVEYVGVVTNPALTTADLNKPVVVESICRNNWTFFFVELKGVTFHYIYYRDKTGELIGEFTVGKDDC